MSTQSPEDESILLQQRPIQTQNSTQIPNISQSESILVDTQLPSIATDSDEPPSVAKVSVQRKRNRIVDQKGANEKRSDMPQDLSRKRRKPAEHRRTDTLPAPANDKHTSDMLPPPPQVAPQSDLLSEDINVVFQDESPEYLQFPNDDNDVLLAPVQNAQPNARDIFRRCFTGNSQPSTNFGPVLADCSDYSEEE